MPAKITEQEKPTEKFCYCDSLDEKYRKEHKIPAGYCGICDVCGKAGHTQHFPGAVPYTGTWCDDCLTVVAKNHKIQSRLLTLGFLLFISLIISAIILGS